MSIGIPIIDVMDPKEIIKVLCNEAGGQTKLAKLLNVSQPTVNGWLNGAGIGAESAIAIEGLTNGRFRCEQIRPDINWAIVRKSIRRKAA
jgi:DNA-binding transcriptional regulator YdaS (Cro superfamily)